MKRPYVQRQLFIYVAPSLTRSSCAAGAVGGGSESESLGGGNNVSYESTSRVKHPRVSIFLIPVPSRVIIMTREAYCFGPQLSAVPPVGGYQQHSRSLKATE